MRITYRRFDGDRGIVISKESNNALHVRLIRPWVTRKRCLFAKDFGHFEAFYRCAIILHELVVRLKMKPFVRALTDFHAGISDAAFIIRRDDGYQTRVSAAPFFEAESFPPIEICAMEQCSGHILDVGSAAGRHSLELIRRGFKVTSLDIAPEMEDIMKDRGQSDVVIADILEFSGQRFDTLLMLMNGIGMVGSLKGLEQFLQHAHQLVTLGGQIVCDSIDVSVGKEPQHVAYREKNLASGRPAGQQAFSMECDGEDATLFDWLHVDFPSLTQVCETTGWVTELINSESDGHYLCKITQSANKSQQSNR